MNIFATIYKGIQFRRITYYTVLLSTDKLTLFDQFTKTHSGQEYKQDMDLIRHWMRQMGETVGASMDYFRSERDAQAIPPPIEISRKGCQLRLYCLRMSPRVVVLFNGGLKTKNTAQECPVVGPHFEMANLIANKLWNAFDKGLLLLDEREDLIIPPDFRIEL